MKFFGFLSMGLLTICSSAWAAGVLPDGTDVPGKRHTYPEMAQTMTTPIDSGYALGWGISARGATGYFSHDSWDGYQAHDVLPIPQNWASKYTGRYRYDATLAISITSEADKLFITYPGGKPEELIYTGDGLLMRRERPAPINESSART